MELIRETGRLGEYAGGVLVPTMGALHEGHASLVRRAREIGSRGRVPVVVSVFVNPTQFNDPADLARYPRTLEADCELCERHGADAVWAPAADAVYPSGVRIAVPSLPRVATEPGLEDRLRPGHFAGVCQVVARLFELSRPRAAVFGEKDWQQLQVVRAMSAGLKMPVGIEPGPTVREADGLAMSSRNRFLTAEERGRAAAVSRALRIAGAAGSAVESEGAMRRVLEEAGIAVEYAVVRHAETLTPVRDGDSGTRRALIAGRLGAIRLIDNAEWSGRA